MHTNHTPGPWRVHTLPNGSHHIVADHWDASVAVTMFPDSGSEGREANARLIAAAPDLLEALENLLPYAAVTASTAFGKMNDVQALIDQAKAVLTKAKGE